MKKQQTSISETLGLTQRDMAIMLGISRSLWSLFELGHRDLPLDAKLRLNEILAHTNDKKTMGKNQQQLHVQQLKRQQQKLDELLYENDYQRKRLAQRKAKTEERHARRERLLQFADFLENQPKNGGKLTQLAHRSITTKADTEMEAAYETDLMHLDIRIELLELEKILLESKLRKIGLTLANTGKDLT